MTETTFFYRTLSSSDFEKTGEERPLIPVRLKSQFRERSEWYDEKKAAWLLLDECKKPDGHLVEYADVPETPSIPAISGDGIAAPDNSLEIEDMDALQFSALLSHRLAVRRRCFDKKNFFDVANVKKDFAAARLVTDYDALTLELTFICFYRTKAKEKKNILEPEESPHFIERCLFFDMKNGAARCSNWDEAKGNALEVNMKRRFPFSSFAVEKKFPDFASALKMIDENLPPRPVALEARAALISLAENFTGISLRGRLEGVPEKNIIYSMLCQTLLPLEPELCEPLFGDIDGKRRIRFWPRRKDPLIYKRFCKKAKIKNSRIVRKCYLERPLSLLTYLAIKDAGFTDINLYNRVLLDQENSNLFDSVNKEALKKFSRFSIKRRGELCTMNTLLKKSGASIHFDREKKDGIEMFARYFKNIPETLKNDILQNGFTSFNHDALSNISYQVRNKKIVFTHTEEEMRLEDDISGYEFRLPKDSYELCEIGTSLHNCVASYADQVEEKECTIVYATKDGGYKLCIEVRGKNVYQERTDHNGRPDKDARAALNEWHRRHGLMVKE